VDEPVRWALTDPRRLETTGLEDRLWVRLLDVAPALAARRYAATDRLVLDVEDGFVAGNSGRYELEAGLTGAECRATGAPADLSLGAAELGAVYLGGVRFSTLGAAGRVREHTPGALVRATALFATDPAPYCGTEF
jgi:predicted acetyltransferase